ncbi:FkbM family methyltransferase [Jatrophihabitans sp.]|uniref:FkbM family methyltransferase n=1 Tax=Jatrophihabitans sp. TaxID=1932789 RepID=UPI0030C733D6
MPWTQGQRTRMMYSMRMPWRRIGRETPVRRTVQGVPLTMPRSHMLPYYAKLKPSYGQNLVALASLLAKAEPGAPLQVLDIGANIGDSALQISAASGAHVLCVEGDRYWAEYLHKNVDGNPKMSVEEVLLLPDGAHAFESSATAVRTNGTTRFVSGESGTDAMPSATASQLRDRNPDFAAVRLVKSDTDGFEPQLVPAVAATWRESKPVLFFEYDPILARAVGIDPDAMWGALAALGYSRVAVWDNAGDPLGQLDIAEVSEHTGSLEPRPVHLGYNFWDVAVCRDDDPIGRAALDELVPLPFSVTPPSA